jgi:DNA helicase HerA-like ATPase
MAAHGRGDQLGVVTGGGFAAGLEVRLDGASSEELQVGSFVVLQGDHNRYFSLLSDLQLQVTDPAVTSDPPIDSPFLAAALRGIHTYTQAVVRPSLVLEDADELTGDPRPTAVRTIPAHFAVMRRAREEDFDVVFGAESDERFALGSPIAMEHVQVPIDLSKLIERSSGIFGQTGAGKSVLARLVLFGLIKSNLASTLVFDMHGEYASAQPSKPGIPGLRDLFGASRIKVYSLDSRDSDAQNHIRIGLNQIEPADIELLTDELNLNDTFFATSYLLRRHFNEQWLARLLEMEDADIEVFASESGAHAGALSALRRKLLYLEDCDYTVRTRSDDPVRDIVALLERGEHVVVQFGPRHRLRDYMLVANLLTRRIHEKYTERSETARSNGAGERRALVVVLEEAHKFLNAQAAKQSIFGTIAREMRKFGVSLLVVDQRPSGIDSEVMSQLGTRISGLLTDENDIAAVLSGTSDRSSLRGMLASLEPSQQCLVVGHAIPMPMILRTRDYSFELGKLLDGKGPSAAATGELFVVAGRRKGLT